MWKTMQLVTVMLLCFNQLCLAAGNDNLVVTVSIPGGDQILHGKTAILHCTYTYNVDSLQFVTWGTVGESECLAIANKFIGVPGIRYPFDSYKPPAYTMTIDDGTGGGSSELTIQAVDLRDDIEFCCTVGLNNAKQKNDSERITVNVLPSLVVISDANGTPYPPTAIILDGTQATFTCTASGHTPDATIHWTLDGSPQTNWPDGTNADTVTLDPEWSHHDQIVECSAMVPVDSTGVKNQTTLDVKVPPSTDGVKLFDANNEFGYNNTGDKTDVLNGDPHKLTCLVKATTPEVDVVWKLNGEIQNDGIDTTSKPNPNESQFMDTTSVLTFTPDCANYNRKEVQCETNIIQAPTNIIAKGATLQLNLIPDTPIILFGNLADGEGVQGIRCKADNGYPDDGEVWWYTPNNNNIQKLIPTYVTDHAMCKADLTSILSYTPKKADNGLGITCEVHHKSSKTINPSVTEELDIKFCTSSVTGPLSGECSVELTAGNQSPDFTCVSGSSNPATTLMWYLGGTRQDDTHKPTYQGGEFNGNVTTLQFNLGTLTKEHNVLNLLCGATNADINCSERSSTPCTLNVKYPPEITSAQALPLTIAEGGNVQLTCYADGNPQPDGFVSWKRNGNTLDDKYTSGSSLVDVTDIDRNQAGMYTCVAENGVGSPDTRIVNVTVHYAPNITNKDDNKSGANEGAYALLLCISQGNPVSMTTWFDKNDTQLVDGMDRIRIEDKQLDGDEVVGITIESRLIITSVVPDSDYGNYTCQASNGVGNDTFLIELSGTTKPEPVQRLYISSSTLSSLTVEWTPGYSGGVDQSFVIKYREYPDGSFGDEEKQSESTHPIMDLLPGTQYEIVVTSENEHGRSESIDVIGRTRQIPEPPISVIISDSTDTSLSVKWEPGYDGEDAQWFLVDYGKTGENFIGEKVNASTNDRHEVTSLSAGTEYVVVVYSKNVNGLNEDGKTATGKTTGSKPGIGLSSGTKAAIAGSVIGVFIIITIVGLSVHLARGSRHSKTDRGTVPLHPRPSERTHGVENTNTNTIDETTAGATAPTYAEVNQKKGAEDDVHTNSCYANVSRQTFVFPRENLTFIKELGHGEFGKVLLATIKDAGKRSEMKTMVAVKTLKDNPGEIEKDQIRKEFRIMMFLMSELVDHVNPNVVKLIGGCMEKDPMYMILEYMEKGDLKTLLRQSRVTKSNVVTDGNSTYGNLFPGSKSLSPPQLITFAREVANGMRFLSEQKCIHRDLAARNVLLDNQYVCKVSDFGLARDVMDVQVYQRLNEGPLPLRWMAYESVLGNIHTTESDVWSFGILLWEIVTLGGRPYPRMSGEEIRRLLKDGNRMQRPKHCSEQLYTVMSSCWEKDPNKRPTFTQIINLLDEILSGQMGYLSLEDLETTLYEDSSVPDANEKV